MAEMLLCSSAGRNWVSGRGRAGCAGEGFQEPAAAALCTADLHCEIAACDGKELNLFFLTYFLLVRGFFFIVFYGYICSSHDTNVSFSVFY